MDFSTLILALHTDEGRAKLATFLNLAPTTFVVRAINDEMKEAQIISGDYVFVNPVLKPTDGAIVLANTGPMVILRRYVIALHTPYLTCDDRNCEDIDLTESSGVEILGVVTGYMHPFDFDQPKPDSINFQQN